MYVDGDGDDVEDAVLRRVLEDGPVLVVARRKDVLSDIAPFQLMDCLYVAQSYTPGVDTDRGRGE